MRQLHALAFSLASCIARTAEAAPPDGDAPLVAVRPVAPPLVLAKPEPSPPPPAVPPSPRSDDTPKGPPNETLDPASFTLLLVGGDTIFAGLVTTGVGQRHGDECADCDGRYTTRNVGLALLGIGAASVIAGEIIVGTKPDSSSDVALGVGLARVELRASF